MTNLVRVGVRVGVRVRVRVGVGVGVGVSAGPVTNLNLRGETTEAALPHSSLSSALKASATCHS